jgi:hypothetical protein
MVTHPQVRDLNIPGVRTSSKKGQCLFQNVALYKQLIYECFLWSPVSPPPPSFRQELASE